MKIQVTLLQFSKEPWHLSMVEFVASVFYRLKRMGHDVVYGNVTEPGYQQIVFGFHHVLVEPELQKHVTPNAIFYNIEQIGTCSLKDVPEFWELAKGHLIWDYAPSHLEIWAQRGITAKHVPLGWVPEISTFKPFKRPEMDLCMTAALNERRREYLLECQRRGLKFDFKFPVYGKERDDLIANAAVNVNIHYYTPAIFETQRVIHLLSNRCFVLSEDMGKHELFRGSGGIVYTPYEQMVPQTIKWAKDHKGRKEVAARGFELVQTLDVSDYLSDGLAGL